jgi:hypothetical protein
MADARNFLFAAMARETHFRHLCGGIEIETAWGIILRTDSKFSIDALALLSPVFVTVFPG